MGSEKSMKRPGVPRTSTVSRALWPPELQRSPAADFHMQQTPRQFMQTTSIPWWGGMLCVMNRMHFFYLCAIVALGLTGMTGLIVLVYGWPVDLVFFGISGAVASLIILLMSREGRVAVKIATSSPGSIQSTPRIALEADPETPLPASPLVRVLETIDLSTCPVEHFLDVPDTLHTLPLQQDVASMQQHP